ncbi:MAG: prolyl oligopeptidase family serine peptidase [Armatimonadota bacterium]
MKRSGETMTDSPTLPDIPGYRVYDETVPASADGSQEPVIIGHPEDINPGDTQAPALPLLVGCHSWSCPRYQAANNMAADAAEKGWLSVYPEFRGPNLQDNPRATETGGSILAQSDIIDAVEHMKTVFSVDDRRIYLLGGSGGGHIATLMAGKYPDVWAAVSAWVPITSLKEWWEQDNNYRPHVEAVCGGRPGDAADVDFEYLRRSPRTFITNAANTPLHIFHGQFDGTIDVEQSWQTFRRLSAFEDHRVSFLSDSRGHCTDFASAVQWLGRHRRDSEPPRRQHLFTDEAKSFFWCHITPAQPGALAEAQVGIEGSGDEGVINVRSSGADLITIDLLAAPGHMAGAAGRDVLEITPGAPTAPFKRVIRMSEI